MNCYEIVMDARSEDRHLCRPAAASHPIHSNAGQAAKAIAELRHVILKMAQVDHLMLDFGHLVPKESAFGVSKIERIDSAIDHSGAAKLNRQAGQLDVASDLDARRVEIWQIWKVKLPNNDFVRRQMEDVNLP